jgi:hypothetical protein
VTPKNTQIASFVPQFVKPLFTRALRSFGYQLVNLHRLFEFDGLHTIHNARFRDDPRFQAAWHRGLEAACGVNPGSEWRVHIGLWAASVASRVPGEFVECGVNAGVLSSAILRYLDWQNLHKRFYLVDTFAGPVVEQFSDEEIKLGRLNTVEQSLAAGAYVTDLERVRRNYQEWGRIEIVQGVVPGVLPQVNAQTVAFLHLDMNCAHPEVEALRFFWDRLSRGGMVLLDDYSYFGYEAQGRAIDALLQTLGAEIVALPTGQGLIVK